MVSPHQEILGEAFDLLDPAVRRAHLAPCTAEGRLDVQHGSHWLTPSLIALLSLPASGSGQPTRLQLTTVGSDVEWTRTIGGTVLRTRQRAVGRLLVERGRAGRVAFALTVCDGALQYEQVWMKAVGGLIVPAAVSPQVRATVSSAPGGWRVGVTVTWRQHLVCRYSGILEPR